MKLPASRGAGRPRAVSGAMRRAVGVVREAYSKWERRAPLTPAQVAQLVSHHKMEVLVQPSPKRVFADHEYLAAGAKLTDDLSSASAIFGVKQVPVDALLPGKTCECRWSRTAHFLPLSLFVSGTRAARTGVTSCMLG